MHKHIQAQNNNSWTLQILDKRGVEPANVALSDLETSTTLLFVQLIIEFLYAIVVKEIF